MAVKRLTSDTEKQKLAKKDKAKKKFKASISSANTVAKLSKCVEDLAAYVLGEDVTE